MARQPKNPFHPGEMLLEEFLEPKGVTQAAFAEKIGWTKTRSSSSNRRFAFSPDLCNPSSATRCMDSVQVIARLDHSSYCRCSVHSGK